MLVILVLFPARLAFAADNWLEVKDFGPVTQRVSVTLENPADLPVAAAVVRIPMNDVRKVLPEASPGTICVVDPAKKEPKRELPDQNFVPSQVSARTLIFSVPLNAKETKQLFIYTAPTRLNMPGFPTGTAYDNRHAYRSFENRFAAFRMETGPGANTTGFTIDAFGKTKKGIGVRLQEIYGSGGDSYHELQDWGVDILKVGSGPGIGGAYVFSGDEWARPEAPTSIVDLVYSGPVETKLTITGPVKIAGRDVTLTRTLTLVADDRRIHDELTLTGADISGLQIGIGVRDLPNCVWVEKPEEGYGFQTGDANQKNYKAVGLGAMFDPMQYVKTLDLPDTTNGGHVYILKGTERDGTLVSRHQFVTIWDMDGQLEKPVEKAEELRAPFQTWFDQWTAQRKASLKVTMGTSAESK